MWNALLLLLLCSCSTMSVVYGCGPVCDLLDDVVVKNTTWTEDIAKLLPNSSPVERMAMTCFECKKPYGRIDLDTTSRHHEVSIPYNGVTIKLRLLQPLDFTHKLYVGTECIHGGGVRQLPVISYNILLQNHVRVMLKVVNSNGDVVDVYWIDVNRMARGPGEKLVELSNKRKKRTKRKKKVADDDDDDDDDDDVPEENYIWLSPRLRVELAGNGYNGYGMLTQTLLQLTEEELVKEFIPSLPCTKDDKLKLKAIYRSLQNPDRNQWLYAVGV